MELEITDKAKEDLRYWKKSGNLQIQKKISQILESIQETPF